MKRKINKKKVIIFVVLLLIITLITALIIYLNVRIVDDNSGFTLKDGLTTEVYTKASIENYIDTIEGDILSSDKVDTETLGTQELTFIYLNKDNKKRRGTIEINVVDTEKPLVWVSNNYSTKVGNDLDLENTIMCVDNYDNKPSCTIKGEYDINTPGTYNLTFTAKDNSGNTYQKDFNDCSTQKDEIFFCYDNIAEKILKNLYVYPENNIKVYQQFKQTLTDAYSIQSCLNKYEWPSGNLCEVNSRPEILKVLHSYIQGLINSSEEKMLSYLPELKNYK